MTTTPGLSIVLTGRNDGYGGDFNARLLRTLRFNHDRLRERGVPHEFVLVEWAPPASRPHLADVVADTLPDLAAQALVTYLVDPRYHEAFSLNPRLAYLEYIAKNTGIRRARGALVLATNTDVYLGRGIVETIAEGRVAAGTVYRATRVDVKLGADESHVHWDLLEDPRNHTTYKRIQPPLYGGASGDFILLDHAGFHALRGFNEVYRLARVGIDYNFLVKAHSSGFPIADIGSDVYHTTHAGSFRVAKSIVHGDAAESSWGRQEWHSHDVTYENPEGWGLGLAPEHIMRERVTWLDFSWNAVPPLADLRRIVLPAARGGQPDPAPESGGAIPPAP